MSKGEHVFQSQGKLLFQHMNGLRSDLHHLGPLWEPRDSWESLGPKLAIASQETAGSSGSAPSLVSTPSKDGARGPAEDIATISYADGSRRKVKRPVPKLLEATSFSKDCRMSPRSIAGDEGSQLDAADADERMSAASGHHGPASGDDEEIANQAESKTDYWIKETNLAKILSGAPLGVQEHQAELRLKKMNKWTEEHPDSTQYTSEVSRLTAHLKKATVAKKLRTDSIVHLKDGEFGACLLALGSNFKFPTLTKQNMVLRRVAALRAEASKQDSSEAQIARWAQLCEILQPCPLGKTPAVFDPKAATLASCEVDDVLVSKMLRGELVENTLVPLVSSSSEGRHQLRNFVDGCLKTFEASWEDFGDVATKVISNIVSCARGIQFLLAEEELGDEGNFADLEALADGATSSEKRGIKAVVGTAVFANDFFNSRLEVRMRCQKFTVVAKPLLDDIQESLGQHDSDALNESHFKILADASKFLVSWGQKLPEPTLQGLSSQVLSRVLACGAALAGPVAKKPRVSRATDEEALYKLKVDFQAVLEDADLAFSLEPKIATLKHDLLEDTKASANARRSQSISKVAS